MADAVQVEPVSPAKFPANREKNREFCGKRGVGSVTDVNNGVVTGLSDANSLLNRTGNYFGETGNVCARTGNFIDHN